MNTKELVTLRKRTLKHGGQSLYLDYAIDGVRTREFLKMYLIPELGKIDKIKNQETINMANAIKAKRILELQEGRAGIRTKKRKDMLLTDFLKEQIKSYKDRGKHFYVDTLSKILKWVESYGQRTTLLTVDKDYVLGFCDYLRSHNLSENTVCLYFSNFNTVFNNAYRAGLIQENPISRIDTSLKPKRQESQREYLTLDEVRMLMSTKCGRETVERAFLFSCFTGLRISDIEALTWEHIRDNGKGLQVEAKQIKTQRIVYIPLSSNALAQLPKRKKGQDKVFDLPNRMVICEYVHKWVKKAGIQKHISFHCARHTYATLLLTYGANIYTVSSLLGHTNVITTQIYAKIIDDNKRKTVDLIPAIGER